ncbi:hypothetical protein LB579_31245 [Mesorhizobium sp. BR1-1-7]|uniref:hypothetical protein n=1 Tax=Mesorhizobium sp. BR1-1-7 TaxID=2876647 RepID=UPI001CCEC3CC|nr:hypothetical protein [Mesorhizobium sp. BR1-1-7]MBZ9922162.1 hypothetical protein [Mesorhizobium sp. BR1-1-7]
MTLHTQDIPDCDYPQGKPMLAIASADGDVIASCDDIEWRDRIVTSVNSHDALVAALEEARRTLFSDGAREPAINQIDAALALARGGK